MNNAQNLVNIKKIERDCATDLFKHSYRVFNEANLTLERILRNYGDSEDEMLKSLRVIVEKTKEKADQDSKKAMEVAEDYLIALNNV